MNGIFKENCKLRFNETEIEMNRCNSQSHNNIGLQMAVNRSNVAQST